MAVLECFTANACVAVRNYVRKSSIANKTSASLAVKMLFYQLIPPTTGGREALSFKVVPNGWPDEVANWPATLRGWNKKQERFYECWDENLGNRASLLEYASLGSQRSTGVLKANQKGPRSLLVLAFSTQPSLLTLFLSFFNFFVWTKSKQLVFVLDQHLKKQILLFWTLKAFFSRLCLASQLQK